MSEEPANPTTRHEIRQTWRLAAPVMIAQLGMMAMGLVDTMMVGPLGSEALAATSVANAVFFTFLIFFMGTLVILDSMISQALGAEQPRRAGELMWQGIYLAFVFGLLLNVLSLDLRWAFDLLEQPERVADLAAQYLTARGFAAVPFLLFVACRSFLNSVGHTRPIMVIVLVANLVNVGADWVLIYGKCGLPALGVSGAGTATALVRWLMALAVAWTISRPRYGSYDVTPHRLHLQEVRRILRHGLPVGSQMLAEMMVFTVAAILAGWLGARALAAHQIAISLASFTFMMPMGLSIAASVRVGHAVGRRDPDAAARAGRVALSLGAALMAAGGLLFVLLPEPLARLFSPEAAVLEMAVGLLYIAALFQISDGIQVVAQGCLRGVGDTLTPLVVNLAAHWLVGMPASYVLAFHLDLGVRGIWFGLTASLTLAALFLAGVFLRGRWRRLDRMV